MWDLPFRANEIWERVKLVAGWLGLSSVLSGVLGVLWAWLCGMTVWWPFFAVVGVGSWLYVRAAWAVWRTKRDAQENAALTNKLKMLLEVIEATKRQNPQHYVLHAESGHYPLTGSDVALLGPAPFIPLRDAMSQAFDRAGVGILRGFAESGADNPDKVLEWFAYFSIKHLPIYGKRPPGTAYERIEPAEFNRMSFMNGARDARYHLDKDPKYRELAAKPEEVAIYLDKIAEIEAELAFDLGFKEETERRNGG